MLFLVVLMYKVVPLLFALTLICTLLPQTAWADSTQAFVEKAVMEARELPPKSVIAKLLPARKAAREASFPVRVQYLKQLADAYYRIGDFAESQRYTSIALSEYEADANRDETYYYFVSLAIANHTKSGELDQAQKLAEQYLAAVRKTDHQMLLIDAELIMMELAIARKEWREGLAHAQTSQAMLWQGALSENAQMYTLAWAKLNIIIGRAFERINPSLAISAYKDALQIMQTVDEPGSRIKYLRCQLLFLSVLSNDLVAAQHYLQEIKSSVQDMGVGYDTFLVPVAESALALAHGNLKEARSQLIKAEIESGGQSFERVSPLFHLQRARLLDAEQGPVIAINALQAAEGHFPETESVWLRLQYQELLVRFYREQGNIEQANVLSEQSYRLLVNTKDDENFYGFAKLLQRQKAMLNNTGLQKKEELHVISPPQFEANSPIHFLIAAVLAGLVWLMWQAKSKLR
jgi:tetratricopeptide (TPR) repeat protein